MVDDTASGYEDPRLAPVEPLRQRLPAYAVVFAVGLGVCLVLGSIWGLLTDASMVEGISWTSMLYGVVLLLIGGTTGGGYANLGLGAFGSIFGGRQNYDEDVTDEDIRQGRVKRRDPRERLRKGLRPPPNPTAFWQVIGGLAYIGVGVLLIESFPG